jgi:hypothetical protein
VAAQNGYKDFPGRALRSGPRAADVEPEAIPEAVQREYSAEARRRWEVVKAEEVARKRTRSRCNRVSGRSRGRVNLLLNQAILPSSTV